MIHPEEYLLVQQSLQGRRKAQQALYERFAGRMMTVCMRYMGGRPAAQDCLQDAFVKFFTLLSEWKQEGPLEGWLRRIVVTTCLEQLRRSPKFKLLPIEETLTVTADADILPKMEAKELLEAMAGLPDGYRTVLNLYVMEHMSHAEIADALGITEGTSKSQLAKARAMLRSRLSSYVNQQGEYVRHA